ncbi:MAG: lytic transglycosylase domain-containing protein [Treponema sp.]|nr:lytic transglycosylase domain-containing protein [Treponema sp.]
MSKTYNSLGEVSAPVLARAFTFAKKKCVKGLASLSFLLALGSCATTTQPVVGSDFYEGLLKRQSGAEAEALTLFKTALDSPNPHIAGAAAAELLGQYLTRGAEFSVETWDNIGSVAMGPWADAFRVLNFGGREEVLALLLSRSTGNPVLHAMSDWLDTAPIAFTDAENAAINGRVAASRFRHRDALSFFRVVLDESPYLFFKHPDLISDLGRAFQFAATGREGIDLFLELEAVAASGDAYWQGSSFAGLVNADNESLIRFQLLFFAGRIARQRGAENIGFFQRALPFAREVSTLQSDATIWYILRSAVDQSSEMKIVYLERYVSYWHDDISFFSVMDRLSRQLILDWEWDRMIHVFEVVRDRQSGITAKFAWIIARAIQEGFIEQGRAAAALGLPSADPVTPLMRIAFDSSGRSLYYRLMSAIFLGETFLAMPGAGSTPGVESDAVQFLLGFFENNAAQFAMQHIRAMESQLSLDELRAVAEALAAMGNYLDSITLITRFTRRETFDFSQMTRRDWELWYPRPFWDLIERYAIQVGIEPALMLALIRAESAFMPSIVSHAGAIGLTQLMPATAEETAARIRRQGGPDFRVETGGVGTTNLNLNDPAVNIHIGTTYLGILNQRLGDPLLALFAYNGGTGRVRSWRNSELQLLGFNLPVDIFLETVPFPETRNYGRGVTSAAAVYRKLYFE